MFGFLAIHRKSISQKPGVANGVAHSVSAGMPFTKLKHHHPPAISVVTFSADVAQLYRGVDDPERAEENFEELSENSNFDENSGFAIVINGHSLHHCLAPELEARYIKPH